MSPLVKMQSVMALRWVCLIGIGASLGVLLVSNDQMARALGVVGVVVFMQVREMLMLAQVPKAEKSPPPGPKKPL